MRRKIEQISPNIFSPLLPFLTFFPPHSSSFLSLFLSSFSTPRLGGGSGTIFSTSRGLYLPPPHPHLHASGFTTLLLSLNLKRFQDLSLIRLSDLSAHKLDGEFQRAFVPPSKAEVRSCREIWVLFPSSRPPSPPNLILPIQD